MAPTPECGPGEYSISHNEGPHQAISFFRQGSGFIQLAILSKQHGGCHKAEACGRHLWLPPQDPLPPLLLTASENWLLPHFMFFGLGGIDNSPFPPQLHMSSLWLL